MGNMWTLDMFKAHLDDTRGRSSVWDEEIVPQIHDIVRHTTCAAQGEITARKNSFSLFGYDVMVDENLNVRAAVFPLRQSCRMSFDYCVLPRLNSAGEG